MDYQEDDFQWTLLDLCDIVKENNRIEKLKLEGQLTQETAEMFYERNYFRRKKLNEQDPIEMAKALKIKTQGVLPEDIKNYKATQ